jgi:hypothetical protein
MYISASYLSPSLKFATLTHFDPPNHHSSRRNITIPTMSLPDNSPPPTNLDEINLKPPNSLYPQGTYQAMRYFAGKCQSGIASLSSTGATAFIADKINKTAQLVNNPKRQISHPERRRLHVSAWQPL